MPLNHEQRLRLMEKRYHGMIETCEHLRAQVAELLKNKEAMRSSVYIKPLSRKERKQKRKESQ